MVDTMSGRRPLSSISLVTLLLMSLMVGMVTVPTVSANNETKNGVVVGTETWSGTHTLTGDVEVAEGAKLIINAGTTVNVPAGVFLNVKGAICAGDAACGATQGARALRCDSCGARPPTGPRKAAAIPRTPKCPCTTRTPPVAVA